MRPFALLSPLLVAVLLAGPALAGDRGGDPAESPDKLYHEGLSLFQNRNFEGAEKAFTRCVELRPGHVPSLYMRGACRLVRGSNEDALADFDAVVAAAPRFAKGLAQRGRARMCLGLYDEARADFDAALAMEPENSGWKVDLEQSKMLMRGAAEFGPGAKFPELDLKAPAPANSPSQPAEVRLLSLLATSDRVNRVVSGEAPPAGMVVVFFQSMSSPAERDWLSQLVEFMPELEALGFCAAAISPDAPDKLFELQEGKDLSFPLFCDTQGRAAWKLGILNVMRKEQGEPLPTLFALDASGRILLRKTVFDPARRDSIEKVLQELGEKTKKDAPRRDG